jgi:hypothetical protein
MLTKAVEKKKSNINKDLEDLARELMSW